MIGAMKPCLIYQPLGLGDILWVQGIVDHFIEQGYDVVYPVGDVYYDMVSKYINKQGLTWYNESNDYPMKQITGVTSPLKNDDKMYMPLQYADRHVSGPLLLAKYIFADVALPDDYRDHFDIKRDYDREQRLIDTYKLYGDYIIVNENFATPPTYLVRSIELDTDCYVHYMNIEQNNSNGFNIFDWIGALQSAQSIHTVETSFCYIIDKYCKQEDIHIYERRIEGWPRTHHMEVKGVYKSKNWIYED